MKNIITDTIINKDRVDDKITDPGNISNNTNANITKHSKISSSMKFYLLKKRFLKKNLVINNINNTLTHEEYIDVT
jgi:hypothetical protein